MIPRLHQGSRIVCNLQGFFAFLNLKLTDGTLVLQVESSPDGRPEAGRGRPPGLLGEFAGLDVGVVGCRPADVVAGLDTQLPAPGYGLHILSLNNRNVP